MLCSAQGQFLCPLDFVPCGVVSKGRLDVVFVHVCNITGGCGSCSEMARAQRHGRIIECHVSAPSSNTLVHLTLTPHRMLRRRVIFSYAFGFCPYSGPTPPVINRTLLSLVCTCACRLFLAPLAGRGMICDGGNIRIGVHRGILSKYTSGESPRTLRQRVPALRASPSTSRASGEDGFLAGAVSARAVETIVTAQLCKWRHALPAHDTLTQRGLRSCEPSRVSTPH